MSVYQPEFEDKNKKYLHNDPDDAESGKDTCTDPVDQQ
jgi:hypothetical protein